MIEMTHIDRFKEEVILKLDSFIKNWKKANKECKKEHRDFPLNRELEDWWEDFYYYENQNDL